MSKKDIKKGLRTSKSAYISNKESFVSGSSPVRDYNLDRVSSMQSNGSKSNKKNRDHSYLSNQYSDLSPLVMRNKAKSFLNPNEQSPSRNK